jgi:hypothetical protein
MGHDPVSVQTVGGVDVGNVQARGSSNCVTDSAYQMVIRTIAGAVTVALYGQAGCLVESVFQTSHTPTGSFNRSRGSFIRYI